MIDLHCGALLLSVSPDVGGSIARLEGRTSRGQAVQWLRPASAEGLASRNPLTASSFPLVPFCNRIRDGRAHFGGREIRFPPNHPSANSPHPLHGIGWLRPWDVVETQERSAKLALSVAASAAWPWRFSATQMFELDERQIRVEVSLRNEDDAPMPAGIGHHPYFPHPPGTKITTRTAAMWEADGDVLPTGLEITDEVRRMADGVVLREMDLDNNFIGWSRQARIDWPADAQAPARHLILEAEPPLDYFVLYCPPDYDFFCAEPVSQCTDWLNMAGAKYGAEQLGGAVLAPGETLTARFALTPGWN